MTFVVGYTTTNVESGKWYMVAVDFQGVGNAQHSIKLQDFIKGTFKSSNDADQPEMQVWDPMALGGLGNYTFYYYWATSSGPASSAYKDFWGAGRTKGDVPGYLEIELTMGQSVWFKAHEDCTITVAGQVCEVKEKNIPVFGNNKWNMLANPWPVPLNINSNINWKAAGIVSSNEDDQPQIQVWDVNALGGLGNYIFYYYWATSSGPATSAYKDFWGPGRTKGDVPGYLNLTVPVGCGFWLKYNGDDTTLTFKQ